MVMRIVLAMAVAAGLAAASGRTCIHLPGSHAASMAWPTGAGYWRYAAHRPSSPHKVAQSHAKLRVMEIDRSGEPVFSGHTEIRDGEFIGIYPGVEIRNETRDHTEITLNDYNGDPCTVPYGMTVAVDEYGQFAPLRCEP